MIAEMVHTFQATVTFMQRSVADVSEQQMVEQPAGVRNHATWTLGHIISSCQGMAAELGATPWLPDEWDSVFGYGSTPTADHRRYPTKSELLTLLTDAATRLTQTLVATSAADLGSSLPDESFPTMKHLLLQVVLAHTAYHAGQLAVWRRAIGKEPVGVFV